LNNFRIRIVLKFEFFIPIFLNLNNIQTWTLLNLNNFQVKTIFETDDKRTKKKEATEGAYLGRANLSAQHASTKRARVGRVIGAPDNIRRGVFSDQCGPYLNARQRTGHPRWPLYGPRSSYIFFMFAFFLFIFLFCSYFSFQNVWIEKWSNSNMFRFGICSYWKNIQLKFVQIWKC
jgi:hypothetical protein